MVTVVNACIECDGCYRLVTLEVNKLSELAANISTVADTIVPYNSSVIIGDTFFERLQRTRNSLQDLLTFVSCFFDVVTTAIVGFRRACSATTASDVSRKERIRDDWQEYSADKNDRRRFSVVFGWQSSYDRVSTARSA